MIDCASWWEGIEYVNAMRSMRLEPNYRATIMMDASNMSHVGTEVKTQIVAGVDLIKAHCETKPGKKDVSIMNLTDKCFPTIKLSGISGNPKSEWSEQSSSAEIQQSSSRDVRHF